MEGSRGWVLVRKPLRVGIVLFGGCGRLVDLTDVLDFCFLILSNHVLQLFVSWHSPADTVSRSPWQSSYSYPETPSVLSLHSCLCHFLGMMCSHDQVSPTNTGLHPTNWTLGLHFSSARHQQSVVWPSGHL